MKRLHLLLPVLALIAAAAAPGAEKSFPGAVGFAAYTPGGRGGQIIKVTNCDASGPGSLLAAIRTKGPRIIVFEVGGVIDLDGARLKINEPFVTIAGQTAPSPGITIIKGNLSISTHDVIVRHLRVRPGEAGREKMSGWEADGIATMGAAQVIIDHCSCTWSTDENLSESGPRFEGEGPDEWRQNTSHYITFSNCIIAEGLSNSTHSKGEHSKGSLLHDNSSAITVFGNLFASNRERNPLAKGGVEAVIVNNWISNPGKYAIHHALHPIEWAGHAHETSHLTVVGNLLEYGPDTVSTLALFTNYGRSPLELYFDDNLAFNRYGSPAPLLGNVEATAEIIPVLPDDLRIMPAAKVKDYVSQNAGARPWDRDEIDQRIIHAALTGTGKIIDSEQEAGGYPQVEMTRSPFLAEEWNLETMERLDDISKDAK